MENYLESDETVLDSDQVENLEPQPPAAEIDEMGVLGSKLAELNVSLDIRLQSQTLPLSEFVKLSQGTVINLENSLSDQLEILANGRVVGKGRLVQIADRIGVEIESWGKLEGS